MTRRMGLRESAQLAIALRRYADERAHARLPRWKVVANITGCGRSTAFRLLGDSFGQISTKFAESAERFLPAPNSRKRRSVSTEVPKFPVWEPTDDVLVATRKALSLASLVSVMAWCDLGMIVDMALRRHGLTGMPVALEMTLACGGVRRAKMSVYDMTGTGARVSYWSPGGRLETDSVLSPGVLRRILKHAKASLSKTKRNV